MINCRKYVVTDNPDVLRFLGLFDNTEVQTIEQSVKIQDDKINKSRILVKYKRSSVSATALIERLVLFHFPSRYLDDALNLFKKSDNVMFALDADSGVYRVYFERSIDPTKLFLLNKPIESIVGLKWSFSDPSKIEYTIYNKIIATNKDIYLKSASECGIDDCPQYVSNMIEQPVYYYYQVHDSNTPRKSICLPLPDKELYILDQRFPEFKNMYIKHIQYGESKDKQQFKTLYYPVYRRNTL